MALRLRLRGFLQLALVAGVLAASIVAFWPSRADADGEWEGPVATGYIPRDICSADDSPSGFYRMVSNKAYPDGRIEFVLKYRGEIVSDTTGETLGHFNVTQTSTRAKDGLPWVLIYNTTVSCQGQGVVVNWKAGFSFDANGVLHEHAIPGSPEPS